MVAGNPKVTGYQYFQDIPTLYRLIWVAENLGVTDLFHNLGVDDTLNKFL
ncbi:MAG: hypothetical protein J7M40_12125 [Planctomycetes bacterium]|nr:hypothetical protein [Planctomycetota bacterium]